jgi:hypothetical protein
MPLARFPAEVDMANQAAKSESPAPKARRPEGKEGAGAHQEGKGAIQAGQTNRKAKKNPENGSGLRNYAPGQEVD